MIASPSIRTVPKTPIETGVSAKAVSEQESDPAGAVSEIDTGGVRVSGFSGTPGVSEPRTQLRPP